MKLFPLLFLNILTAAGANASDKILLIGDSHSVMDFGKQMIASLGGPAKVARYAVAGSSARSWLNDPICPSGLRCPFTYGYATPSTVSSGTVPASFRGFASLHEQNSSATVVFALGTNDADILCRSAGNPSAVKSVVDLLGRLSPGQSCYWVGPPSYRRGPIFENCGENFDRFVNQLRSTVANRCTFIDSRTIEDPQTGYPVEADAGDRVHFKPRTAISWAKGAAALVRGLMDQQE